MMRLHLSNLDSDRFGLRAGRADNPVDSAQIEEIERFIDVNNLDLMIVRCSSRAVSAIHGLERKNFLLMEGRTRYIYRLINNLDLPLIKPDKNTIIRPAVNADDLEPLVRISFFGYRGHYHNNPRLNLEDCDNIYVDWALAALSEKPEETYCSVVEQEGKLVGFATGSKSDDGIFTGGLLGVAPEQRRRGLASALHSHRLQWCKSHNTSDVIVATSLNNWPYQNLLTTLGYRLLDSDLTFHWVR